MCARACVRMRVCVCVRVRACVCVCVCVCACVYVCVCVLPLNPPSLNPHSSGSSPSPPKQILPLLHRVLLGVYTEEGDDELVFEARLNTQVQRITLRYTAFVNARDLQEFAADIDLPVSLFDGQAHHVGISIHQLRAVVYVDGSFAATAALPTYPDFVRCAPILQDFGVCGPDRLFLASSPAAQAYVGEIGSVLATSAAIVELQAAALSLQALGSAPRFDAAFSTNTIPASSCLCPRSHPLLLRADTARCATAVSQGTDAGNAIARIPTGASAFYPEFAIDADAAATAWQSPRGVAQVNFTLTLPAKQHISGITLAFAGFAPHEYDLVFSSAQQGQHQRQRQVTVAAVRTSCDGVATAVSDWQTFAAQLTDQRGNFAGSPSLPLTCVRAVSGIDRTVTLQPFDNANLLAAAGAASSWRESTILTSAAEATLVQVRFLDHGISDGFLSLQQGLYYGLRDISLSGSCVCNGHAEVCGPETNFLCQCLHGTSGDSCDACQPLLNNQPWAPSSLAAVPQTSEPLPFACQPCNCNNHASSCFYNATLMTGQCNDCTSNTTGPACASCAPGFTLLEGVAINETAASPCTPCNCDVAGSLHGQCQQGSGQCACKQNVIGVQCDTCAPGFINLNTSNPLGCELCQCNPDGTVGGDVSTACDTEGDTLCECKPLVQGALCDACVPMAFGLGSDPSTGCTPCHEECREGCTGPLPSDCFSCSHFFFQDSCLAACPPRHYPLHDAGLDELVCTPCDDESGCIALALSSSSLSLPEDTQPGTVAATVAITTPFDAMLASSTNPSPGNESVFVLDVSLASTAVSSSPLPFEIQVQNSDEPGSFTALLLVADPGLDIDSQGAIEHYPLELTASIEAAGANATAAVSVTVTPVNDNAPVIDPVGPLHVDVREDHPMQGRVVSLQGVTDGDAGPDGQVSLSLQEAVVDAQDAAAPFPPYFALNGFAIVLVRQLDFETGPRSFSLVVTATDGGDPVALSSTLTITVDVTDINDNAPVVQQPVFSFSVAEHAPARTFVGRVAAQDADSGLNGELTFSIASAEARFNPGTHAQAAWAPWPDAPLPVVLDGATGLLNVTGDPVIDRDFSGGLLELRMVVVVSDQGQEQRRQAITNVTITVADVNDNAAVFDDAHITSRIAEDTQPGAVVARFRARDAVDTAPNANVVYSVHSWTAFVSSFDSVSQQVAAAPGSDAVLPFTIHPSTGTVTLVQPGLDFELVSLYNLTVEAADTTAAPQSAFATLLVRVADVNEHPPKFAQEAPLLCRVPEGTYSVLHPFLCATVTVTDEDGSRNNSLISLSTNPVTSTLLLVEESRVPSTGALTANLVVVASLDFEAQTALQTTLVASDGGAPALTATIPVIVNVTNVEDEPPAFVDFVVAQGLHGKVHAAGLGSSTVTITVSEAVSSNLTLGALVAVDPDHLQQPIQIGLVVPSSSSSSSSFPLAVASDGTVTLVSPLDFETQQQYDAVLTVSDGVTPAVNSTLLLAVTNANDNAPTVPVEQQALNISVLESDAVGHTLVRLNATDADVGDTLSFSVVASSAAPGIPFSMAGPALQVSSPGLDFEAQSEFELVIQIADSGEPEPRTTTVPVLVHVIDVDDHPLQLTFDDPDFDPHVSFAENDVPTQVLPSALLADDDGSHANRRVDWLAVRVLPLQQSQQLQCAQTPPFGRRKLPVSLPTCGAATEASVSILDAPVLFGDWSSDSAAPLAFVTSPAPAITAQTSYVTLDSNVWVPAQGEAGDYGAPSSFWMHARMPSAGTLFRKEAPDGRVVAEVYVAESRTGSGGAAAVSASLVVESELVPGLGMNQIARFEATFDVSAFVAAHASSGMLLDGYAAIVLASSDSNGGTAPAAFVPTLLLAGWEPIMADAIVKSTVDFGTGLILSTSAVSSVPASAWQDASGPLYVGGSPSASADPSGSAVTEGLVLFDIAVLFDEGASGASAAQQLRCLSTACSDQLIVVPPAVQDDDPGSEVAFEWLDDGSGINATAVESLDAGARFLQRLYFTSTAAEPAAPQRTVVVQAGTPGAIAPSELARVTVDLVPVLDEKALLDLSATDEPSAQDTLQWLVDADLTFVEGNAAGIRIAPLEGTRLVSLDTAPSTSFLRATAVLENRLDEGEYLLFDGTGLTTQAVVDGVLVTASPTEQGQHRLVLTPVAGGVSAGTMLTLLNRITYANSADEPTAAETRSVRLVLEQTASDGTGTVVASMPAYARISITLTNDPPHVAFAPQGGESTALLYVEGAGAVSALQGLEIADVDSANLTLVDVRIQDPVKSGESLHLNSEALSQWTGLLAWERVSASHVVARGPAPPSTFNAALAAAVAYELDFAVAPTTQTTIAITASDDVAGESTSNTARVVVSFKGVNTAPVLGWQGQGSGSGGIVANTFFEDRDVAVQGLLAALPNITVFDADTDLLAIKVHVSGLLDGSADEVFSFQDGSPIPASQTQTTATTWTWLRQGVVSPAAAQELLQSLAYNNLRAEPTTGMRTISVQAIDTRQAVSAAFSVELAVVNVNDPPLLDLDPFAAGSGYSGSVADGRTGPQVAAVARFDNVTLAFTRRYSASFTGTIRGMLVGKQASQAAYRVGLYRATSYNGLGEPTAFAETASARVGADGSFSLPVSQGQYGLKFVRVFPSGASSVPATCATRAACERGSYGFFTVPASSASPLTSASVVTTPFVSDAEGQRLAGATLQLTGALDGTGDGVETLVLDDAGLLAATGLRVDAELTAVGAQESELLVQFRRSLGLDEAAAVLGFITYSNSLAEASPGVRTVAVSLFDVDGLASSPVSCQLSVQRTNDNAPQFVPESLAISVSESALAGTRVGTVACTDADAGVDGQLARFQVLQDTSGGFFSVDDSGNVLLLQKLDYELGFREASLLVLCFDGGSPSQAGTGVLSITVTDSNDNMPTANASLLTLAVPENAVVGQHLATVLLEDQDADTTFAATAVVGNSNGVVALHIAPTSSTSAPSAALLHLSLGASLDFEQAESAYVAIVVSDGASRVLVSLSIQVEDVNEFPPVISVLPASEPLVVSEAAEVGDVVFTVDVSDGDSGAAGVQGPQSASVAVYAGDHTGNATASVLASDTFAYDAATGRVSVAGVLQWHVQARYWAEITAEDGAGVTTTAVREIAVEDTNDHAPQFSDTQLSFHIAENYVGAFATIPFSDLDAPENSKARFTIVANNANNIFTVSDEGVLAATVPLDHEYDSQYFLIVSIEDALDAAFGSSLVFVYVNVDNVQDEAPIFVGGTARVSLNLTETPDGQADPLLFTVLARFRAVDPDHDSDGDGVADGGDSPMAPSLRFGFVGGVEGTGSDGPGQATGLFLDSSRSFGINGTTGEVLLLQSLDREDTAAFDLTVFVEDAGGAVTEASLHVTVLDINDNAPSLPGGQATLSLAVSESHPVNGAFFTIPGSDPDALANGQVEYMRNASGSGSGSGGSGFVRVATNGTLFLGRAIDFETDATPDVFEVIMSDGGSPIPQTTRITVTVAIANENDEPPVVFTDAGQPPGVIAISVAENTRAGTELRVLNASDPDTAVVSPLQFALVLPNGGNGGEGLPFAVDRGTGVVSVSGALDREAQEQYEFAVAVSDSIHTVNVTVRVTLTDENDKAPEFLAVPSGVHVLENQTAGWNVTAPLPIVDQDLPPFNAFDVLTLDAATGLPSSVFAVDPASLSLQLIASLNHTAQAEYALELVAQDANNASLATSALLTVSVVDVNDHVPVPLLGSFSQRVEENSVVGTRIGQLRAFDADAGENKRVVFALAAHGDSANQSACLVAVDAAATSDGAGSKVPAVAVTPEGSVSVAAAIDRETTPMLECVVVVSDSGREVQLSTTATLRIVVTDVNDSPPVLPSPDATVFNVSETASVGTVVGVVVATDADTPANAVALYSFAAGSHEPFAIDELSGRITVASDTLDVDEQAAYTVAVRATDAGVASLTTTTTITIAVLDENTLPPEIGGVSGQQSSVVFVEDGPAVPILPALTLSDPDDRFQVLHWAIVSLLDTEGAVSGDEALSLDAATNATVLGSSPMLTATFGGSHAHTLTIMGEATLDAYVQLLQAVFYKHASDEPSVAQRTVEVQVFDGRFSASATVAVAISFVQNHVPVVFLDAGSAARNLSRTVVEQSGATQLFPFAGIQDVDAGIWDMTGKGKNDKEMACVRAREREIQRERETHTHTDTQTHRHTYTHRERYRQRKRL